MYRLVELLNGVSGFKGKRESEELGELEADLGVEGLEGGGYGDNGVTAMEKLSGGIFL